MGCIGYCIGARSVLRAMLDHPDEFAAGVALHPSYCATEDPDSPHLELPGLRGTLYAGIAGGDQMISAEERARLAETVEGLGDRGIVDVLEGADHGYGVPGPRYEEDAAGRAYAQAFELFGRTLR